jgi:hypothetical protein
LTKPTRALETSKRADARTRTGDPFITRFGNEVGRREREDRAIELWSRRPLTVSGALRVVIILTGKGLSKCDLLALHSTGVVSNWDVSRFAAGGDVEARGASCGNRARSSWQHAPDESPSVHFGDKERPISLGDQHGVR